MCSQSLMPNSPLKDHGKQPLTPVVNTVMLVNHTPLFMFAAPVNLQSLTSYSPFTSYALSKMCNTMMAAEYQRRFDRHDACTYGHDSAVAIHPGIVATSLATGFFTQVGGEALFGGVCWGGGGVPLPTCHCIICVHGVCLIRVVNTGSASSQTHVFGLVVRCIHPGVVAAGLAAGFFSLLWWGLWGPGCLHVFALLWWGLWGPGCLHVFYYMCC
jgi:hypothetical protein